MLNPRDLPGRLLTLDLEDLPGVATRMRTRLARGDLPSASLHESSPARSMPTDRIFTDRCDTTLVGRGRSSD